MWCTMVWCCHGRWVPQGDSLVPRIFSSFSYGFTFPLRISDMFLRLQAAPLLAHLAKRRTLARLRVVCRRDDTRLSGESLKNRQDVNSDDDGDGCDDDDNDDDEDDDGYDVMMMTLMMINGDVHGCDDAH